MKKPLDFSYAYPRAVKYLSIRPRSVQEMREYLAKKQVESGVAEQVIARLLSDKFLNDEEFAEWWIRGRQNRGKAAFLIKRELEEKGVEREIIERELAETGEDDLNVARDVVEKYHYRYARYSGNEYFQKMGAFLARRGFSWDVIRKALTP